jgi:hypothetical protein
MNKPGHPFIGSSHYPHRAPPGPGPSQDAYDNLVRAEGATDVVLRLRQALADCPWWAFGRRRGLIEAEEHACAVGQIFVELSQAADERGGR